MRRGAAAKPRSEAARKRSAKARGEGKRRRLRSFLHRTLHDAFRRRSNNCHAVATSRVFPISMGKSQKKGSCGEFLRCDRILLSRQRQDTIKSHRARSLVEKRVRWSRDDGRGKIAAQQPPRKPSPFQWGRWHRAANTAVKRAHKLRDDGRGREPINQPASYCISLSLRLSCQRERIDEERETAWVPVRRKKDSRLRVAADQCFLNDKPFFALDFFTSTPRKPSVISPTADKRNGRGFFLLSKRSFFDRTPAFAQECLCAA